MEQINNRYLKRQQEIAALDTPELELFKLRAGHDVRALQYALCTQEVKDPEVSQRHADRLEDLHAADRELEIRSTTGTKENTPLQSVKIEIVAHPRPDDF